MANRIKDGMEKFEKELDRSKKLVEREAVRIKKAVDSSVKQADAYIRKNPEKAVAIASGIAAALGAATALIATHGKKKAKK
ncbi:MAG: hypothetical protein HGA31_03895 [Candidatus Moranbacteria bacterium]|nr:hypothetical protein [Candidatus Moranbacteria bacterium]